MEEIVHIIPLGFEIDRVVKTFEKMKANRVYILYSHKRGSEEMVRDPEYYLNEVVKRLEDMKIEVIAQDTAIFDIIELLSAVSRIIVEEKKKQNIVYVNMCAAGKIASVASTIAAMYHDVKVYYVKSDEYPTDEAKKLEHGMTIVNDPGFFFLTNFTIDIPTGAKGSFLVELNKKGEMTNYDILKMISENKLEGFGDLNEKYQGNERSINNKLVRINNGLLDELVRKNYIEIERRGRKKIIKITDKGKYASCLFG